LSGCSGCNLLCSYTHMARWMSRTPGFQVVVVLISSPLSLIVALWGMTSNQMLQIIKSTSTSATVSLIPVRKDIS
jgi:hypothetical protein